MLDLIDPNRFLLIRDDFLRYFLIEDTNTTISGLVKENKKLISSPIFDFESNQSVFKEPKAQMRQKNEMKTVRNFKHLTIMHLILFCCQQFSSYSKKLNKNILQKTTEFYSKMIPEYKTKEGYNLELITSSLFDEKSEKIKLLYEKNISRNTCNKSLLNSFFNIIDEGLNTHYLKDFLPMVKAIKQKLEDSNNSQQGQERGKLINLRKYLLPKIESKLSSNANFSILNLYKDIYLNLEDKYMKHLSDIIKYENYHISKSMQNRVDAFNKVVLMKKKLLEKKIKVRIITDEENFTQILSTLFKDINTLNKELSEKEEQEKNEMIQVESLTDKRKESNKDMNNSYSDDDKGFDEDVKSKKTNEKINPNTVSYRSLLNLKKDENIKNSKIKELLQLKKIRENNSIPTLDIFLNSLIIFILPSNSSNSSNPQNMLSNYIGRHDAIYKSLISRLIPETGKNINETKYYLGLLSLYLTEAKDYFELNIYKAVLVEDEEQKILDSIYFYSYMEIDLDSNVKNDLCFYDLKNQRIPISKETNNIKKIIIVNIIPDIKGNIHVSYLTKENSGMLDVYLVKVDKINTESTKLFDKILNLQSVSDYYRVGSLIIKGKFKRVILDTNFPKIKSEEEKKINEIRISPANYLDINQKNYNFKAKIATFVKI